MASADEKDCKGFSPTDLSRCGLTFCDNPSEVEPGMNAFEIFDFDFGQEYLLSFAKDKKGKKYIVVSQADHQDVLKLRSQKPNSPGESVINAKKHVTDVLSAPVLKSGQVFRVSCSLGHKRSGKASVKDHLSSSALAVGMPGVGYGGTNPVTMAWVINLTTGHIQAIDQKDRELVICKDEGGGD